MASVNLAAAKIANVLLGWPIGRTLIACSILNVLFAATSGLWGVLVTDFIQFGIAMGSSFAAAYYALGRPEVGGLAGMLEKIDPSVMRMVPDFSNRDLALSIFVVPLAVQWWATWYPGAEPGGGGYVAQRILAAKDERHGLLATLWFQIAHYALRPWPWILVGFVALIRYPNLANPEEGYVRVMVDVLPSPLKGLLVATFAAAYMSTIGTHLNWGASYLVNDVYLRFISPQASRRAQVVASRVATVTLMLLSLGVMAYLQSVEQGWKILIGIGAGTGAVFILRWYWWRINAWSELSAMLASFVVAVVLHLVGVNAADTSSGDYALAMLVTVGISTAVWVTVTLLTPPEPDQVLEAFYRRVRPGGPGWRRIATRLGYADDRIPGGVLSWVNWVAGVTAVYTSLFGLGAILTGRPLAGLLYGVTAVAAFLLIHRNLRSDPTLDAGVDRAESAGLGLVPERTG
jgi:Na+/proline symporter